MTLGIRIGQYRRKLGLTQDALAKQLDVTNQAVSKWESDQCCPDISLLPRIADIFGITMDELFGRETPVQEMPQPEPESIPESEPIPEAEPDFGQEAQEETRYNWKDSFWGNLFGKTIQNFDHRMKEFDEKLKKDMANWKEPIREQNLPDDIELDWEDDQTLRVALFVGKRLIAGHPARERIEFCCAGPALNIHSECSVTCDSVAGNVWAGGDVSCDDVGGSVRAGGDTNCDTVYGWVQAGGDVSCDAVHGDVKAGGDVSCDEVLGNVTASGDVSCDEIQGNVQAGGDVDCDHLEGSITASGSVNIG